MSYIYIRCHSSYKKYNAVKLGLTTCIAERDSQYATGEIIRGEFFPVYEITERVDLLLSDIERKLKLEFSYLNIKHNAGTEFFNVEIIGLIEKYFDTENIIYKSLTKEEINALINLYKTPLLTVQKWTPRDYQIAAIANGLSLLRRDKKFYLDLPTGGGKSYITYSIINQLTDDIDLIIIQSPRKIVNLQNMSNKYLDLINKKCNIYNYSLHGGNKHIDKFLRTIKVNTVNILIICTQSIEKIYEKIKNLKILIWFDEAHWGIENWISEVNKDIINAKNYYLLNKENIKYRIFASASPDTTIVKENESIFGELYSPIKVKQLISLNYLCNIIPYVYMEDNNNINCAKYMLNEFSDKNRKFGFSFHNSQLNAFNLFYSHYIEYTNSNTNIKPFLLIGDDFIKKETLEEKNDLKKVLKRIKSIHLDYKYTDINEFQTLDSDGGHIGYVVAKYSIGYDFCKLDFLSFNDPKLSFKDIIQCIGRGLRIYIFEDGKYKELVISLPIFISGELLYNPYENIKLVLKYLLCDIGLTFNNIHFSRGGKGKNNKLLDDNTYDGGEDMESIILDLFNDIADILTYERAKIKLENQNIKTIKNYQYFAIEHNLKYDNLILPIYPDKIYSAFNWVDYLSIKEEYYTLNECQKQIKKIIKIKPELKKYFLTLNKLTEQLCKINTQFPPYEFWEDYYKLKLSNIIDIEFLFE